MTKYGGINDMPYGWRKRSLHTRKVYSMWLSMLNRCHNEKFHDRCKSYKDCTHHTDFYYLSKFYDYLQTLPRWQEFLDTCNSKSWSIDKDMIEPGNKEYTYGKISLVPISENVIESNKRTSISRDYSKSIQTLERNRHKVDYTKVSKKLSKQVIAVNVKDNSMLVFSSIKQASEKGFDRSCISECVNKHKATYRGYKWFQLNSMIL